MLYLAVGCLHGMMGVCSEQRRKRPLDLPTGLLLVLAYPILWVAAARRHTRRQRRG